MGFSLRADVWKKVQSVPELFWMSLVSFTAIIILAAIRPVQRQLDGKLWLGVFLGAVLQAMLGMLGLVTHHAPLLFAFPPSPVLGTWAFRADALSSLLFLLLGCIGAASSLMAVEHAKRHGAGTGAGMTAVVSVQFVFTSFLLTAQNFFPLLIAWEAMSLCAYAYILVLHHRRAVRRAAYITLLISEVGFLMLVLAAILATTRTDAFDFVQVTAHLRTASAGLRDTVFLLALFGFGAKSGILPMQLWMPDAYDAAPAHLNAILAGGLLNLGLFGVLRVTAMTGALSVWVSLVVLWLGVLALFAGALFAVIESRLRRLLAYSSIENVGLMVISLGVATVFAAHHNALFANVAMMAVFVQMVSHALAKALAFLTVGEVGRRFGSTDLERLGGLFQIMPGVGLALLIASLTLATVAPFSGFASEWLTFQGMLQVYRSLSGPQEVLVAVAGMFAAAGAALAMTAFLKVFVFAMTGRSRTSPALSEGPHRTSFWGGASLSLLGVLSLAYGWFPTSVMSGFQQVIGDVLSSTGPLRNIVPTVFHSPVSNPTMVSLGAGGLGFFPAPGFVIQPGEFVATIAPTYILFWFVVFVLLALGISRLPLRKAYATRTAPAWLGGREHRAVASEYTSSAYANPYRMFWSRLIGSRINRQLVSGTADVPRQWQLHRKTRQWLGAEHWFIPTRAFIQLTAKVRYWQHGYLWGYLVTILGAVLVMLAIAALYR